jgi:cell division protein FtsB
MLRFLTSPAVLNGVLFLGAAFLIASFAYAALHGPNGIGARTDLEKQVILTTAALEDVRVDRAALQNKVRRLSDDFLDLDLLDEQARRELVLIRPDEQILR